MTKRAAILLVAGMGVLSIAGCGVPHDGGVPHDDDGWSHVNRELDYVNKMNEITNHRNEVNLRSLKLLSFTLETTSCLLDAQNTAQVRACSAREKYEREETHEIDAENAKIDQDYKDLDAQYADVAKEKP